MHALALPAIAAAHEGGFFAGRIQVDGRAFGIVVAPKAEGELADIRWHRNLKDVQGAISWNDGLANTEAMAAAGSPLATKIRALTIGGFTDWYLPALDELELCYRAFKPTTEQNSQYSRSGINVSALPPTYPYTLALPAQTGDEPFRLGGAEAFDPTWYWSSSQHASYGDFAWYQYFGNGFQSFNRKDLSSRARAVRRIAL